MVETLHNLPLGIFASTCKIVKLKPIYRKGFGRCLFFIYSFQKFVLSKAL